MLLVVSSLCWLSVVRGYQVSSHGYSENIDIISKYIDSDTHDMKGTVYVMDGDNYEIQIGSVDCESGIACGSFDDSLNHTGWSVLDLASCVSSDDHSSYSDEQCMFAAGMLEGYLTSFEIYRSWSVMWDNEQSRYEGYTDQIANWSDTQREWVREMIENNPEDPYWQYTELLNAQYQGLQQGYALAANDFTLPALSQFDFDYLNANEEWPDLLKYFNNSERTDWFDTSRFDSQSVLKKKLKNGHCSGLVKVTPELDDLFISHSTWFSYHVMNRVYKMYHIHLSGVIAPNRHINRIHFSGYPGALSSIDDWYLFDNGLAVFETTNEVFNTDLYDLLKPQSMFVWQRVRVASSLAKNNRDWIDVFGKFNSGTYNNQWVALQFDQFEKGQPLPNDLLWIGEQMPGFYQSADVTNVLERGYWPSFNVPALHDTYQVSGQAKMAEIYGPTLSYDLAPRARLFRAYADEECVDLPDTESFMRYNDYLNDAYSDGNPGWAIMSRYDLKGNGNEDVSPFGGIDSKLLDLAGMQSMNTWIQAGPTHDTQPVFDWDDQFPDVPHQYLPTRYDFDWIQVSSQF